MNLTPIANRSNRTSIISLLWIACLIAQHSFAFTTTLASVPSQTCPNTKATSLSMSTAEETATKQDQPFGAWVSPISSRSITAGSVRLGGLKIVPGTDEDAIYWLEGRPLEGGRNVLVKYSAKDGNMIDQTPKETNVRTRVHEYGGAATTIVGETVYYSEFTSQQVYKLDLGKGADSKPTLVTGSDAQPKEGDGPQYRYADGIFDDKRNALVCVREDHGSDGKANPKDVVNEIVAIDVATGNAKVLVKGYDFVAAPKLSNDGTELACIVWDHPNMPWDATKLVTVSLSEDLFGETASVGNPVVLAGQDEDTSVIQPLYHPTTGDLLYISDETGYYNLYAVSKDRSASHALLPMDVDFGGASPGWMLGQMGYSVLEDGRLAASIGRDGSSVLVIMDVTNWDMESGKPVATEEYTSKDGLPRMFGSVQGGTNDNLYFMGGDPATPSSVYRWNLSTKEAATVLKSSSKVDLEASIISTPERIEFPTTLGTAFGYYYAPKNGGYECTTEKAPPLLVKAHGGPTAATTTSFNPGIQYWTSRGFAVLDVDYGGSTGYGRDYRRRLRGSWGIVDIDDVCNGAKYLVDKGLADSDKLCIDGGSAGGYTTLGALAFKDVFKAGCSLYGVADLSLLASDTHKFESRYLDGLVGKYPEQKDIYEKRSPILSVDTLNCPILLLQGDEDKIVPPNQAEEMHKALLEKGIPTCLKIYEGEQHGFRKSENIEDALDSELAFYGKVFGINVPEAVAISIDNM